MAEPDSAAHPMRSPREIVALRSRTANLLMVVGIKIRKEAGDLPSPPAVRKTLSRLKSSLKFALPMKPSLRQTKEKKPSANIGVIQWEHPRDAIVQARMVNDIKELIEQLRDPARVYPIPGDSAAADKIATLLENAAIVGKAPLSTVDVLKDTAVRLLGRSHLLS
ncbi:hypothetical protein FHX08_006273 [Rhizobium sp. BK529]|uniref:hypothetical protein n=1 Tax=Rhizobium sp. BK529 TaxID=2586983 RepID=UPI0017CBD0BD|nr:hypothetical protein [Rhizobium sp. BK529]MBB3595853.1 hypothetical protein [Rhizobium sp. BK529]